MGEAAGRQTWFKLDQVKENDDHDGSGGGVDKFFANLLFPKKNMQESKAKPN